MENKKPRFETPEKDSQSTDFSADIVSLSQGSSFPSPIQINNLSRVAGDSESSLELELVCDLPTSTLPLSFVQTLDNIIPQLKSSDLINISHPNRLRLVSLVGQSLQSEIKKEAERFRHPQEREKLPVTTRSSETIKLYDVEELLVFFESCTGKSGRRKFESESQLETVATIQNTFYEAILKGSNLKSIGPYQLQKVNTMRSHVQSRAIHDSVGGSYSFHQQTLSRTNPIEMQFSGVLISDNAQKGASKFQHHAFGKLDRSTPVSVCTHNIRAVSVNKGRENDNEIFKHVDVIPANHKFHSLFRPVGNEFINVVLQRQEEAAKKGNQARNGIIRQWMDKLVTDREAGLGKTTIEKLCEKMDYGTDQRTTICVKCHNENIYQAESQNICVRCHNNPTYYGRNESGPYKCFKFKENPANTVIVTEQEPININPNGKKNLIELYQILKKEYWPSNFLSYPFYGDGLPCISYERMQVDCIECLTHNVHVPLHDKDMIKMHCNPSCSWDWPLKDLHIINGESHEEIAMLVVSLSASVHFGLLEMLEDIGRHSRASQLQAIKTKRLHTLYEINFIFTKGSMMACMVPYLNHCSANQTRPDIKGLLQYVSNSKNMKYQARFRVLMNLNLPCIVKRVGIRLNNSEIAGGASGLFFPMSFAFKQTFYRDYYHSMFLNGQFSDIQETIEPAAPDLSKFIDQESLKTPPILAKYPTKHPTENVKFGVFKSGYSYLTESTNNDGHEGGDFTQENQLGRIMPFLEAGKIFNHEVFTNAARKAQLYRESQCVEGNNGGERKSPRPKYEAEVQSLAALVLYKNECPDLECDLEELHEDVLRLPAVGIENYKKFFERRIKAIPTGSIILTPAFLTKAAHIEFDRIENQTKQQIVVKLEELIRQTDFSDEKEKAWFISRSSSKSVNKQELLDLYNELVQMIALNP